MKYCAYVTNPLHLESSPSPSCKNSPPYLDEDAAIDWKFCPGCGKKIRRITKKLPKGALRFPRRLYGPLTAIDQLHDDTMNKMESLIRKKEHGFSPFFAKITKPRKFPKSMEAFQWTPGFWPAEQKENK
jgi:hypothetical protein